MMRASEACATTEQVVEAVAKMLKYGLRKVEVKFMEPWAEADGWWSVSGES